MARDWLTAFFLAALTVVLLRELARGEEVSPAPSKYLGLSAFAILHPEFPCSRFLRAQSGAKLPRGIAILYGTFGHSWDCVKRFQAAHPRSLIEIHLSNEAGRRNRRLKEGELLRQWSVKRLNYKAKRRSKLLFRKLSGRIQKIVDHVWDYPDARYLLSTGLEDNYITPAYRVIYEWTRKLWPFEIVRNPLTRQPIGSADFLELHGLRPNFHGKTCLYNNDGTNTDVQTFRQSWQRHATNCSGVFYWLPGLQGIAGANFVEPRRRRFGFSDSDFHAVKELLQENL